MSKEKPAGRSAVSRLGSFCNNEVSRAERREDRPRGSRRPPNTVNNLPTNNAKIGFVFSNRRSRCCPGGNILSPVALKKS